MGAAFGGAESHSSGGAPYAAPLVVAGASMEHLVAPCWMDNSFMGFEVIGEARDLVFGC